MCELTGAGVVGGDLRTLGNNTKFATPPNDRTIKPVESGQADSRAVKRIARYDLQKEAGRLLPNDRVAKCCWCSIAPEIKIIKQAETKNTRYNAGLMKCGGVWVCPVCSAKITERRRVEIKQGLDVWQGSGGGVFMVTFTMQHNNTEALHDLLSTLTDTLRAVQSGAAWDRLKDRYQIAGSIRAIEITTSKAAGWHPHAHVLFFTKCKNPNIFAIKADFTKRYTAILSKNGKYASFTHGVDVREGDTAAADYLAKMGIETPNPTTSAAGLDYEISKGLQKGGKIGGHFTPFDLLVLSARGDKWAGKMFAEYASATKGINQIRWGRGLRDLLEVGKELTDTEIAESDTDTGGIEFYSFSKMVWKIVRLSKRREDRRGFLLEVARETTNEQYTSFINLLLTVDSGPVDGPLLETSLELGGVFA